jgi:hypothetical protein
MRRAVAVPRIAPEKRGGVQDEHRLAFARLGTNVALEEVAKGEGGHAVEVGIHRGSEDGGDDETGPCPRGGGGG